MATENSYFVSDLHMFSRRSQSHLHEDEILALAADAHTFVLGGDIFDFRWSTLPSVAATVDASIEWLERLVGENGHCKFHFVLGNHDSNQRFVERLGGLSQAATNLEWHEYYVRLGQSMFLHGDVADRRMTQRKLIESRTRWQEDEQRSPIRHLLYDSVVHLRLHKIAATCIHRPRRVAKRILVYLEDIGHGPASGLQDVYFGHTHAPMSEFEYAGLKFHNGGAPINGLDFRILETNLLEAAISY